MKNPSLSQLDVDQMNKRTFQEDVDAQRVILVGGGDIQVNVDTSKIEKAMQNAISNIKLDMKMPEMNNKIEEKHIFIPQIQIKEIEKPIFIKEIEIREIQVPVIIKETQFKEIEKTIIVTEYKTIEVPVFSSHKKSNYDKFLMVMQTLLAVGLLIKLILK
jgi:hypothetical protein